MSDHFYIGIIPARGGSKRIPGKNLALLNGHALIDYTLRAAAASRRLGACMVSTDSEAIASHVRMQGVPVPALRPASISGDRSPVIEALQHAVAMHERSGGRRADAVCLLQPTSPLRSAVDIDRAIDIFERTGADTVTAVREVRDHPYWAWRRASETIVPFVGLAEMTMDRKALPAAYAENGAVYVIRRELIAAGTIYGDRVVPLVMDDLSSVDVDTPLDLAWAEFLLARRDGYEAGNAPG